MATSMDAYDIWMRTVGGDYTPQAALEEASEREMTIEDMALEITSGVQAIGHLTDTDTYAVVFAAVRAQIEDAFEQQTPNI